MFKSTDGRYLLIFMTQKYKPCNKNFVQSFNSIRFPVTLSQSNPFFHLSSIKKKEMAHGNSNIFSAQKKVFIRPILQHQLKVKFGLITLHKAQ